MQRLHSLPGIWAGIGLFVAGWIIFGIVQTRWYAQHLGCSTLRAFGNASRALFECVVAMTLLSALFQ